MHLGSGGLWVDPDVPCSWLIIAFSAGVLVGMASCGAYVFIA